MNLDGQITLRAAAISEPRCERLEPEEAIRELMEDKRAVWLDARVKDRETARRLLQDELGFHPLAVEDALSDRERPTVQEYEGTVFLSVPVPHRDGNSVEFSEIGFFLRNRGLVTVSRDASRILDDWFERWKDHPHRIGDHPAFILHSIIDAIVDGYMPLVDDLEDEIEELTEKIYEGDTALLPKVMGLKRTFLRLRRAMAPTRDVMNSLLRRDFDQIPDEAKLYFQDVFDHTLRLTEVIDANRDALTSVLDVHLSTVSNNLNVVVKKMTVLSTVLMTMALIAGIYGMNFKYMPELDWRFGYPLSLGLMAVAAGLTLLGFKLVRWI